MLTIKELSRQVGLKPAYIRKCLDKMPDLFTNALQHGQHNTILIDNNGVAVFLRIKQYKDEDLTVPEIYERLQTSDVSIHPTSSTSPIQPQKPEHRNQLSVTTDTEKYIQRVFELQNTRIQEREQFTRELQDKDAKIADLMRKNDALEGQIKALPDGKSPAELRAEYDRNHLEQEFRQRELTSLIEDLKQASGLLQGKRRQQIVDKIEALVTGGKK